jgi:hypothetical protein
MLELLNAGRLSPGGIPLPYAFLMSVIKDKNSERVDSLRGMVIHDANVQSLADRLHYL